MKGRIFLTALLCTTVSVVPTWLAMQPLVSRAMISGESQRLSLLLLLANLMIGTALMYLVLRFSFGRPIERIATSMRELAAQDDPSGGLLLRLDRALRRLAFDLGEERQLNERRLRELSASNEALLRLQAELVATDRLATLGKLASGVAHEVGNPLAGILGYLSVVRMRAKGNDELLDLAERIEAEVNRIDGIVRGLLELGRPSRGKAQAIDVRPIIDSCVRLLGASRDFEKVQVEVEAPASLWLRAEPGPLSQVLVNLLLNAAQAMQGEGRVKVGVLARDTVGQITVDDEGPGLPPEVKAHLFEPFFTTKEAGKGTGLGLAVSQHLLSQFDGKLEAGDAPGRGARFVITLPAL